MMRRSLRSQKAVMILSWKQKYGLYSTASPNSLASYFPHIPYTLQINYTLILVMHSSNTPIPIPILHTPIMIAQCVLSLPYPPVFFSSPSL